MTPAVQRNLKNLANWEISQQLVNGSDDTRAN